MEKTPNPVAKFKLDGKVVLEINLETGVYTTDLGMNELVKKFWFIINDFKNKHKNTTIILSYLGVEKIRIDANSGKIYHEIWNPETAFLLDELEKRFHEQQQ